MYSIYHVQLIVILKTYSILQEVAVSVTQTDHEAMSKDADTESFNLT